MSVGFVVQSPGHHLRIGNFSVALSFRDVWPGLDSYRLRIFCAEADRQAKGGMEDIRQRPDSARKSGLLSNLNFYATTWIYTIRWHNQVVQRRYARAAQSGGDCQINVGFAS
jgi:hypothetical protein